MGDESILVNNIFQAVMDGDLDNLSELLEEYGEFDGNLMNDEGDILINVACSLSMLCCTNTHTHTHTHLEKKYV